MLKHKHATRFGRVCGLFVLLSTTSTASYSLGREAAETEIFGIAVAARQAGLQADVPGAVSQIFVEEGQLVAANEALAVIDDRTARAEFARAEAAAESYRVAQQRAELEVELAETRHRNMIAAHRAGASTDAELLELRIRLAQAMATRDEAAAKWKEAKQVVAVAKAQIQLHTMRAPFAGRIIRVRAKLGERPDFEQPLFVLQDDSTLKLELHVPIAWFGKVSVGESYSLEAEAPIHKRVPAVLQFAQPSIDAATRTFRCVFHIDNSQGGIPAGLAVRWLPVGGSELASGNQSNSGTSERSPFIAKVKAIK